MSCRNRSVNLCVDPSHIMCCLLELTVSWTVWFQYAKQHQEMSVQLHVFWIRTCCGLRRQCSLCTWSYTGHQCWMQHREPAVPTELCCSGEARVVCAQTAATQYWCTKQTHREVSTSCSLAGLLNLKDLDICLEISKVQMVNYWWWKMIITWLSY